MSVVAPASDFHSLVERLRRLEGAVVADHRGWRLHSAFQPIYSLSHGRVAGHEALLRAFDAEGRAVPPSHVFDTGDDLGELLLRDRLARLVHLANHPVGGEEDQWLFLNVHPRVFERGGAADGEAFVRGAQAHFQVPGHRVVVEVLEHGVGPDASIEGAVQRLRELGCLIALDDFGAGHSNFDRVWRLRPEIVKLDRSLVQRAARDASARRIVVQMVSLLHECGALVLMEGVETEAEAIVALESDADLVQGFWFGRPRPTRVPPGERTRSLQGLWDGLDRQWQDDQQRWRERIDPYRGAMEAVAVRMARGQPLAEAASAFLSLPAAETCFLLDAEGRQQGHNLWTAQRDDARREAFAPLRDSEGARWARRPYFRRAVEAVGQVQVTRPYRTLHGGRLCVTVSVAFFGPRPDGVAGLQVVCGDVHWP